MVIGETLESEENWTYSFRTKRRVGRHTYIVTIERKPDRLELNALFPYVLDSIDLYFWRDKLQRLNCEAKCGDYTINPEGNRVIYRVYSLYSSPDEVKDAAAIRSLLDKCMQALETQAEPMLAPGWIARGIESLKRHIGAIKNKNDKSTADA